MELILIARIVAALVVLLWAVVWRFVFVSLARANGHRPLLDLILRIGQLNTLASVIILVAVVFVPILSTHLPLLPFIILVNIVLGIKSSITYLLGRRILGQDWRGRFVD